MNIDEGQHALELAHAEYPITNWHRILYIGICDRTFYSFKGDFFLHYIKKFNSDFQCTIVERYKPYIEVSAAAPAVQEFTLRFIHADICDWVNQQPMPNIDFDVAIWWHGPEHVLELEYINVLSRLEAFTTLIIAGGPLGDQPDYRDDVADDEHKSILTIEMFHSLGYKTAIEDRTRKKQGPHVTAWKYVKGI